MPITTGAPHTPYLDAVAAALIALDYRAERIEIRANPESPDVTAVVELASGDRLHWHSTRGWRHRKTLLPMPCIADPADVAAAGLLLVDCYPVPCTEARWELAHVLDQALTDRG